MSDGIAQTWTICLFRCSGNSGTGRGKEPSSTIQYTPLYTYTAGVAKPTYEGVLLRLGHISILSVGQVEDGRDVPDLVVLRPFSFFDLGIASNVAYSEASPIHHLSFGSVCPLCNEVLQFLFIFPFKAEQMCRESLPLVNLMPVIYMIVALDGLSGVSQVSRHEKMGCIILDCVIKGLP